MAFEKEFETALKVPSNVSVRQRAPMKTTFTCTLDAAGPNRPLPYLERFPLRHGCLLRDEKRTRLIDLAVSP
jgi:hypothetical protein